MVWKTSDTTTLTEVSTRSANVLMDLQDVPIRVGQEKTACTPSRRFSPLRAFRVPPAIYRLIGPPPVQERKRFRPVQRGAEHSHRETWFT